MAKFDTKTVEKFKWDIILLLLITLGIICSFLYVLLGNSKPYGDTVNIMIDGELYNSYSLNKDENIVIDNEYGFNRIVITNGEVKVTESDCRKEECLNQKAIAKAGESIICLPHRLVVSISSNEEAQYDSIVY